jgi:hypothetical protein
MNRITGIKIDKRLADNIPNNFDPLNIPDAQLIKITVTVVNEKDIPQSGVPVNWSVSNNPGGMIALDENKQIISGGLEKNPTPTDNNGNAIIYVGAKFKSIFNLGCYLNSQSKEDIEQTIKEYQQTLVCCTFDDDQNNGATLPAPTISTNGDDGSVQIPFTKVYGLTASLPPSWYTSGTFAAWFQGKVKGYAGDDDEIGERLIMTGDFDPQMPITYQIPYQWMVANGTDQNHSAILLYSNSGTMTRTLTFAANGEAMALPDFNASESSSYPRLNYAYSDIDRDTLGKKDLDNHNGAFDFIIPDYQNRSETDKIEINVYINAWDEQGLSRKCRQVVTEATLGDFNHGDNYIYSLPGSVFTGYNNDITGQLGLMFLCYTVNDRDAFVSQVAEFQLDFPLAI